MDMTTRTARCGCGRFEITVEGEPLDIPICHCDFCQRRTGSVFSVMSHFREEQVTAVNGDTKRYNGVEIGDDKNPVIVEGINYYFCTTCGSTMYADFVWPFDGRKRIAIQVGNFVDPEFPTPTVEYYPELRHRWVVSPVEGA